MSNLAIKVEHLSKMYRLGEINNGTLWQDIQTWAAIKRKKEDPNSKIGENKYKGDKDHFWALKDVSFDINQGDRVGIIGKNGAGKSTLLKILSRITTPTEGTVKIKGKVASLLEVGTGFHGELTGRENIYLNGAILGMRKRRIDEKLDEIIAFSGIEQHIDTPVKRYSSGMYVRLAFAVAAHLDSDILIADEVLAVGDAEFQKKALGKMQDLSTGEGRTVLFVSHNMGAVRKLCNIGMVLNSGKVQYTNEDIEKSILNYMGYTTEIIYLWENNGNIDDIYFKPLRMYLTDNTRKPLNNININNDIYLAIESEILSVNPLLNVGIIIQNNSGENIVVSWLRDFNTPKIIIGKNDFFIKLPINDFNCGNYKILLYAGLHHQKYIIQPGFEPAINFSINNIFIPDFGDDKRHATLVPKIEWKTYI